MKAQRQEGSGHRPGWSSLDGGLRRSLEAERKFEPQSGSPASGQLGAHSRHSTKKASKGTNSLPR